jgi:ribonuclease T2
MEMAGGGAGGRGCGAWREECGREGSGGEGGAWLASAGLWPNDNDGNYPCNCSNEAFDPTQLTAQTLADMALYWPSLNGPNNDFWSHEWSKHGTCAALQDNLLSSQEKFFNTTLALRTNLNAEGALTKAGIVPSNSKTYATSAISTAIGQGNSVIVQCTGSYLAAVEICYDSNLNRIDCSPNAGTTNCPTNIYYISST